MSVQAMTRVMELSQSKLGARLVMLCLANHDGDLGCFPSIERIASEAHMSARQVYRCVAELERIRELKVERKAGPNGTNRYFFLLAEQVTLGHGDNLSGDNPGPEMSPEPKEQGSSSSSSSSSSRPNVSVVDRPDVEGLCQLLADLIEANGVKRPSITETWRREMRLLIDRDGYAPEVVERVIRFVQADDFERPNVLGVPKLRKRFAALKLKTERGSHPAGAALEALDDSLAARIARGKAEMGLTS